MTSQRLFAFRPAVRHLLEAVLYAVRHALRRAYRHPWFALSVTLSLTIALGLTAAVFSLEDFVDIRAQPYAEADRLVSVQLYRPPGGFCGGCRTPSPEALTRQIGGLASFEAVSAYRASGFAVRDEVGAEFIRGIEVGPEYFRVLGVKPIMGRPIQASDLWANAEPVLVASYEFWRSTLGADNDVIGRRVALIADQDGLVRNFSVIGVMPRGFNVPANTAVWVAPYSRERTSWIIARLRSHIDRRTAEAQVRDLLLATADQETALQGSTAAVLPLREDQHAWLGVTDRRFLLVGLVALSLIIACMNVVTMFLSRLASAEEELATRAAIGATTSRLAAELLGEMLVLGVLGGAGGLLVAYWAIQLLTKGLGFAGVPLRLDARVVLFELGLAVLVACAIGVVLGLTMRKSNLVDRLRSTNSGGFRGGNKMQSASIVIQVAGAVVFTSAALQGVRQLMRIEHVDLGFNPDGLVTIVFPSENLGGASIPTTAADTLRQRVETDVDRFAATNGVLAAAAEARPVLESVQVADGSAGQTPQSRSEIQQASVTSDYFRTMGIPVLLGRSFSRDDQHGSPTVGIVSRSVSEQLWSGVSPIGKRLLLRSEDAQQEQLTIVGMVADARRFGNNVNPTTPLLYRPFAQVPAQFRTYWIRSRSQTQLIVPGLLQAVADLRPSLSKARYPTVQILSEQIEKELAVPRLNAVALSGLAVCTAALAAIGIVGVAAHAVRVRRREIGIRVALGASASNVLLVVVGSTCIRGGLGVLLGMAASFATSQLLQSSFNGLEAPGSFLILVSGLVAAAVVASAALWPARQALSLNPASSLRFE